MSDLIERLEKATGPDRRIDATIHEAVERPFVMEFFAEYSTEQTRNLSYVPSYTSSIDAALTLFPDGWFGRVEPRFHSDDGCVSWLAYGLKPDWSKWHPHDDEAWITLVDARAQKSAIALCIAALKARNA